MSSKTFDLLLDMLLPFVASFHILRMVEMKDKSNLRLLMPQTCRMMMQLLLMPTTIIAIFCARAQQKAWFGYAFGSTARAATKTKAL